MWLAKELTPASYPAIGDSFGGRDHTTVLHACRTINELRATDTVLNHDLHVLMQVLRG
jgi:chromosomal replication initiator protein